MENKNLLYEIYGTTLTAQQIEANIRRRRNIEYEQDLIEYSEARGRRQGRKEVKKAIIKKLISKGKTIEEVSELLDFPVKKVIKYLKK